MHVKTDKEDIILRLKKTGRITAAALCVVLAGTGSIYAYPAFTAYAANYEKVDGRYLMPDGTVIEGVVARGIDVSRWQTTIDWKAVAADDVQFVMLGTRSKGAVDPYFHSNVKGASDAGIRVGAYIYSTATTEQMAIEEADFVLDLVKDYPISFPIAFDAEDSSTLGTLAPAQVSAVINAFCKRIEDAGYYPIVYANDNWLSNKIDMSRMHHDVWVARYEKKHVYSDPIMWQITSTGSINGIKGNVDIDFLYKDLTPDLPGSLWRTIGGKKYYYKDYVMQKDAWVDDGTGWFYMNGDGLASTGWLTKAGLSYYLAQDTGRMVTGWQEVDSRQYYFNGSGAMVTGWVSDDGSWYYMDADGVMKTGWLEVGGKKYFLEDLGVVPGEAGGSSNGGSGGSGNGGSGLAGGPGSGTTGTGSGTAVAEGPGGSGGTGGSGLSGGPGSSGGTGGAGLSGGPGSREGGAGRMVTGWKKLSDRWYFFDRGSGAMATGWLDDNGGRYYLAADGVMATGWMNDGNARYYLTDNGAAASGWMMIDGSWYYFGTGNAMSTGWINPDGSWYYLDTDGKMKNGWLTLDGKTYYLSASSGRMITGWRDIDGAWYYFDGSGAMMTGLVDIGGKLYYLNPADGKMASSVVLDFDGVEYAADESGVCTVIAETGADGTGNGRTTEAAGNTGTAGGVDAPGIGAGSGSGNTEVGPGV